MIADRDAPSGDEHVGGLRGAGEGAGERIEAIGHEPGILYHRERAADQRGEHRRIAGGEQHATGGPAGGDELVPGREQGDAALAAHRERAVAADGGEREAGGSDPLAGADQHVAAGKVAAARADVRVAVRGSLTGHADVAVGRLRLLLDQDRVRACGQGGAGEDPRRLSGSKRAIEAAAGGAFAHQSPGAGALVEADGIAVHRREIGGRLVPPGDHLLGGEAIGGGEERDGLDRQRRCQAEEPCLRLGDRQQAHARQSPERPPDLASRRMPPIAMPRSSALAMS